MGLSLPLSAPPPLVLYFSLRRKQNETKKQTKKTPIDGFELFEITGKNLLLWYLFKKIKGGVHLAGSVGGVCDS